MRPLRVFSELYWTIATAWARLGNGGLALEALQSAVRTGCRDATWMERDPEFEILRDTAGYRRLVEDVRAWPGVRFEEHQASEAIPSVTLSERAA